jgi:serine/threonine protein kinase
MEYFPNRDLGTYYTPKGQHVFREEQAFHLIHDMHAALRELRNLNFIVRDISPSTILVRENPRTHEISYVIADLDSVYCIGKTPPTNIVNIPFSPPESLEHLPSYSIKSDIFSLGMVVSSIEN